MKQIIPPLFAIFLFLAIEPAYTQQVRTQKNVTAPGEPIDVDFSGFRGDGKDWIAICRTGMADNQFIEYRYLKTGETRGTRRFSLDLEYGQYEIRGYTDGNYIVKSRYPFRIGNVDTNTLIIPMSAVVAPGQPIEFSFSGFPGNEKDWVGISGLGFRDDSYAGYVYLNKLQKGVTRIQAELPSGKYELRAYFNNERIVRARVPIRVGNQDTTLVIRCDPVILPGWLMDIRFSGMPGNKKDWIGIAPAGSPESEYLVYGYTNGMQEGNMQLFAPETPGQYELRAYLDDGKKAVGRFPFRVGNGDTQTIVFTEKRIYRTNEKIKVLFKGFPGSKTDWIAIAPEGTDVTNKLQWTYTQGSRYPTLARIYNKLSNGIVAGQLWFDSLPPGTYEARGFFNDEYVVRYRHRFQVQKAVAAAQLCRDDLMEYLSLADEWSLFMSLRTNQVWYPSAEDLRKTIINMNKKMAELNKLRPVFSGLPALSVLATSLNGTLTDSLKERFHREIQAQHKRFMEDLQLEDRYSCNLDFRVKQLYEAYFQICLLERLFLFHAPYEQIDADSPSYSEIRALVEAAMRYEGSFTECLPALNYHPLKKIADEMKAGRTIGINQVYEAGDRAKWQFRQNILRSPCCCTPK